MEKQAVVTRKSSEINAVIQKPEAVIPAKAGRPKGGGVSRSERAHPVPGLDSPVSSTGQA